MIEKLSFDMIFVDSVDKTVLISLAVVQFEANRCKVSIKNMEYNIISFRTGQNVVYPVCRSKGCSLVWYIISYTIPSMQNHTCMPDGMLHEKLTNYI